MKSKLGVPLLVGILCAAVSLTVQSAKANTVTFSAPQSSLNTSFADGTFSTGLSGLYPDGFYSDGGSGAYNAYGQTGETILFNTPVTLQSLQLEQCAFCDNNAPYNFTVIAENASGAILQSISISPSFSEQTLTFDQTGVSQLVFDVYTNSPSPYGDGRANVAWYDVSNITYSVTPLTTPLPAALPLFATGLGGLGLLGWRRKRKAQHRANDQIVWFVTRLQPEGPDCVTLITLPTQP
jgi:hypothetical protein